MALLEISNLRTYYRVRKGEVKAVDGVDFHADRGRTVGLVGAGLRFDPLGRSPGPPSGSSFPTYSSPRRRLSFRCSLLELGDTLADHVYGRRDPSFLKAGVESQCGVHGPERLELEPADSCSAKPSLEQICCEVVEFHVIRELLLYRLHHIRRQASDLGASAREVLAFIKHVPPAHRAAEQEDGLVESLRDPERLDALLEISLRCLQCALG